MALRVASPPQGLGVPQEQGSDDCHAAARPPEAWLRRRGESGSASCGPTDVSDNDSGSIRSTSSLVQRPCTMCVRPKSKSVARGDNAGETANPETVPVPESRAAGATGRASRIQARERLEIRHRFKAAASPGGSRAEVWLATCRCPATPDPIPTSTAAFVRAVESSDPRPWRRRRGARCCRCPPALRGSKGRCLNSRGNAPQLSEVETGPALVYRHGAADRGSCVPEWPAKSMSPTARAIHPGRAVGPAARP